MQAGHSFDERLLHWIAEHRVHTLTSFTTHLMDAGQSGLLLWGVAALGVVFVVITKSWRMGLAVGISYFASGSLAVLLKNHFQRMRPEIPDAITQLGGYSMPSTHATFTIAPVIALLVVVRWKSRRQLVLTATVLGLVVVLIGASMVYLGAHWATDVLAGWALGAAFGAGVGAVFRPRTGQSVRAPHRSVAQGHDD